MLRRGAERLSHEFLCLRLAKGRQNLCGHCNTESGCCDLKVLCCVVVCPSYFCDTETCPLFFMTSLAGPKSDPVYFRVDLSCREVCAEGLASVVMSNYLHASSQKKKVKTTSGTTINSRDVAHHSS